jgi:chemotaxis protein CheC
MNDQKTIWSNLIADAGSEHRLRMIMWCMARGLSDIAGRTISNDDPIVERVPVHQVSREAGDPEAQMVGIYLVMRGGLRGQALLILSVDSALNLVDLMMGKEPGTATDFGEMECSALAEVGNIAVSRFLAGVASLGEMPDVLYPSPPAVMVNMLGATLDVIVTPVAAVRDDLLIIDTAFKDSRGVVEGRFWVLPDPSILDLAAQV